MRGATVDVVKMEKHPIIRLEMEDGSTLVASANHSWLTSAKVSGNQFWETAESIRSALMDGRPRYIRRFFNTWKSETSYDAGWLAGVTDGEGYLSFLNRDGVQLGVAQRLGSVWERLTRLLTQYGFVFSDNITGGVRYSASSVRFDRFVCLTSSSVRLWMGRFTSN
jgi:hypothetical protein